MNADNLRAGIARMTADEKAAWLGKAFHETADQQAALYGLAPVSMAAGLLTGFIGYSLAHMPPEDIETGLLHVLGKVRAHIVTGNETRQ